MRFPVLSLVGTLLVILAIARMGALVLHDPLLGFANQYDMIRTGACVGLYPDLPADKRDEATADAPLERYKLGLRDRVLAVSRGLVPPRPHRRRRAGRSRGDAVVPDALHGIPGAAGPLRAGRGARGGAAAREALAAACDPGGDRHRAGRRRQAA